MSAASPQKPFDLTTFGNHMIDWIRAGLTKDQVVQAASADWPTLQKEYIERTYDITQKIIAEESPAKPVHPFRDACASHRRRKRFLRKIEARIEAKEDAPVALLNLYRGLLRDFEASSYKLLQLQRTLEEDHRRRHQEQELRQQQKTDAMMKEGLEQYLAKAKQYAGSEEEEEDDDVMPTDNKPAIFRNGVMASILLLMTVALTFLSVRLLPRNPLLVVQSIEPVVESLQADPQFVGRSRLIPLMFVEHAENMLDFDILQRPPIQPTARRSAG